MISYPIKPFPLVEW